MMTEKNRDILIKAIRQLPDFQLPEGRGWKELEAGLGSAGSSTEGLSEKTVLPEFKAPQGIWERVELGLDKQQLPDLPHFKAPEGIWKGIDKRLDRKTRQLPAIPKLLIRIAASILILITLGIGVKQLFFNDSTALAKGSEKPDEGFEALINPALCSNNPRICNSPEFKELNAQLEEVQSELKKMRAIMPPEEHPQLLKYFHRLENEQMNIEKKLIKLIIES